MKKTTEINHSTSVGKAVKIIIERIQGSEPYRIWDDGYEVIVNRYENTYYMTVEYEGKTYNHRRITYSSKAPGGRYINLYGNVSLCLPEEKWAEIDNAISEKISEEMSPSDKNEIKAVQTALERGWVMPKNELFKRRKEYNDFMNEGGEGFNPYDSYLSSEYVDRIKKAFPDHFKA